MTPSDYKTILVSVRPQRVAVFVDRADPDWRDTCLRIVEFYSTLWGGRYNIIVPTDGEKISTTFWKILETFDPDYLYKYLKTLLDLKIAKPDEYNRILDRETVKWLAETSGADRDESRRMIDEQLSRALVSKFEVSQDLQNELKHRLVPFYFENWIVQAGGIGAQAEGHYPLTSLSKILPNTEHPNEMVSVEAPGVPDLWYSAVTGRVHEEHAAGLEAIGIHMVVQSFGDRVWDLFNRVLSGWTDPDDNNASLPFSVTMNGLGLYRSLKYRYWEEPAVVVIGDTLDDFCLYYCLSRLRDRVSWLLPSWFAEPSSDHSQNEEGHGARYTHAFRNLLLERNTSRRAVLLSSSMERNELERLRNNLDAASKFGSGTLQSEIDVVDLKDSLDSFLQFPLVAYERDNLSRDLTKQFLCNKLAGLFETPKPKTFRKIDPAEHRWITELLFHGYQLPRHPSLGTWVVRDKRLGTGEARAGRNGIAYFCPNVGYFGGDIDTVLIKPSLYVPDASDLFIRLSQEANVMCKLSDKGFYGEDTIRRFRTLENAAAFFRDGRKRALFEKFLDTTKPGQGIHDEGVFLVSDQRRYLDFASVRKILDNEAETIALIDDLIRSGVFYRGFIFKCAYCRNADWFLVDDIGQNFACKRCNRKQVYTKDHWRHPEEPRWYYKLDEIVYQGARNDMLVPLLALDYLRRKTENSFLYTNDMELCEVGADEPFFEIDLCCIPDGILTIGEAKKENRLGATASEEERTICIYRDTANRIGATQVIFATLAGSWSETTKNRIAKLFRDTNLRTVLLTGNELLAV